MEPVKICTWSVLILALGLATAGLVLAFTHHPTALLASLVGALITCAMKIQLDMIEDRETAPDVY